MCQVKVVQIKVRIFWVEGRVGYSFLPTDFIDSYGLLVCWERGTYINMIETKLHVESSENL